MLSTLALLLAAVLTVSGQPGIAGFDPRLDPPCVAKKGTCTSSGMTCARGMTAVTGLCRYLVGGLRVNCCVPPTAVTTKPLTPAPFVRASDQPCAAQGGTCTTSCWSWSVSVWIPGLCQTNAFKCCVPSRTPLTPLPAPRSPPPPTWAPPKAPPKRP